MPTRLRLRPRQLTLEADAAHRVTLPVGAQGLAEDSFRHDPPGPADSGARSAVEDALMATGLAHDERGALITSEALLRMLPGLCAVGGRLSREEIEPLFQRLASASPSHAAAAAGLPAGREAAAALLILRQLIRPAVRRKPSEAGVSSRQPLSTRSAKGCTASSRSRRVCRESDRSRRGTSWVRT
jgi:hypothetical protein